LATVMLASQSRAL